jgi:transcriptional regulator with XRE-family HTH domain
MATTFDASILNVDFIRSRRLEVGMTRRQLADACKATDRALLGLERGENHAQFPLFRVALIAEALGVSIADLLVGRGEAMEPASNDVRVEAALLTLHRHPRARDVRHALGLSEFEWDEAITGLRQRLAPTGATLVHHESGHCWVGAREGVLTRAELEAVKRPERARTELGVHQARMLSRILNGDDDPRRLAASQRRTDLIALGYLERNDFIRLQGNRYALSGDIAYSLGLTNTPPRHKRQKTATRR